MSRETCCSMCWDDRVPFEKLYLVEGRLRSGWLELCTGSELRVDR